MWMNLSLELRLSIRKAAKLHQNKSFLRQSAVQREEEHLSNQELIAEHHSPPPLQFPLHQKTCGTIWFYGKCGTCTLHTLTKCQVEVDISKQLRKVQRTSVSAHNSVLQLRFKQLQNLGDFVEHKGPFFKMCSMPKKLH